MSLPSVALVHLVRRANGQEAPEQFLASYERYAAGIAHDLVLVLKGFDGFGDDVERAVLARAAAHAPRIVRVSDEGYDLTAYAAAVDALPHERFCFCNSFSEVLADGWLAALCGPLGTRTVGATAATGSWGSHLGYGLWQVGLGGGYDDVFEDRRDTRLAMHAIADATYRNDAAHWLQNAVHTGRDLLWTALFPAVHLRTNAFAIRRSTWVELGIARPASKRATYLLESGRRSITARLRRLKYDTLVVDRRGRTWEPARWHEPDVFWQGAQRDLLVADNQTRSYADASGAHQTVLSRYAWGLAARPDGHLDG